MVMMPVDLVSDFIHRPRPISQGEYEEKKKMIGQQAQLLHDVGKDLVEEVRNARNEKGGYGLSKRQRKLAQKESNFRRVILNYITFRMF